MEYSIETMREKLHELDIPEYMHEGIIMWITRGIRPGNFLTSVLTNDLCNAAGYADGANKSRLHNYVKFFYNYAPTGCWGSEENFATWRGAQQAAHN